VGKLTKRSGVEACGAGLRLAGEMVWFAKVYVELAEVCVEFAEVYFNVAPRAGLVKL
jgi:hypothetical protein